MATCNCLVSAESWRRMSTQKRYTRKVRRVQEVDYPPRFAGLPRSCWKKTHHTNRRVRIYMLLPVSATRYVLMILNQDLPQSDEYTR
jgi:hypothetical protein